MMIDDDPTSLAIGKALLGDDFQLSMARSGHQALGALQGDERPDLILLDMMMPDMGGIDLLRALKGNETLKDIPVIFLTGEDELSQQIQCFDSGAADFLVKPVSPEMLRIRINQQIAVLKLRRENKALKDRLRMLVAQFESYFHSYLD